MLHVVWGLVALAALITGVAIGAYFGEARLYSFIVERTQMAAWLAGNTGYSDILWAYREILRRDPCARDDVLSWLEQGMTREALAEAFMATDEFRMLSDDQKAAARDSLRSILAISIEAPPPSVLTAGTPQPVAS